MNGLNSVGGANGSAGPAATDSGGFEAAFSDGLISTSAVLMQFIGAEIIESVMKDEASVD